MEQNLFTWGIEIMSQIFYASPIDTFAWANGATGHRTGVHPDTLGPYAKVVNCPIMVNGDEVARLTCYATGYADTYFSIPACTRKKGKHVKGYFKVEEEGILFIVCDRFVELFP